MKKPLIFIINFYRMVHGIFFYGCCRYYPSCSQYAIEALETHGVIKGLFLSMMRVLRCHPLHRGGWDPVPEKSSERKSFE
jgi:putative membrane protein insertion efficiency factor